MAVIMVDPAAAIMEAVIMVDPVAAIMEEAITEDIMAVAVIMVDTTAGSQAVYQGVILADLSHLF